jgi:hypothetical protein
MSGPELRYVLLRHEVPPSFGRGSHWDLMLEPSADAPATAATSRAKPPAPSAGIRTTPTR